MLAFQRGDRAAFEQLFTKHVGRVVAFAAQFVGSRAQAEELAQDVFLRLFRTRSRYTPTARFSTWLYRMVTNACVSTKRRPDFRMRRQALHPIGDDDAAEIEIPTASTEDGVANMEALRQMHEVIAELPAQQRAALLLARGEGLSYDEVAASLGCSVSAVKSLVHRATITLRERLGEGY